MHLNWIGALLGIYGLIMMFAGQELSLLELFCLGRSTNALILLLRYFHLFVDLERLIQSFILFDVHLFRILDSTFLGKFSNVTCLHHLFLLYLLQRERLGVSRFLSMRIIESVF